MEVLNYDPTLVFTISVPMLNFFINPHYFCPSDLRTRKFVLGCFTVNNPLP